MVTLHKCKDCDAAVASYQTLCEDCTDFNWTTKLQGFREQIREVERSRKETARLTEPRVSWRKKLWKWLT